ncbi:MAG TPA: type II secretion system minor pseudopilin GspJ [Gallionella sp.]
MLTAPMNPESLILNPRSFTQQLGVTPLSCAGKTHAVSILNPQSAIRLSAVPAQAGNPQSGFTLIELLVSLVILALLSVAGYRSLDAVIQTRERVATETHKWQHLTFFFARVEQDIAQAVHRSVRDSSGLSRPEWIGHAVVVGEDDAELTFTRAGIPDQGITMQSPLRIAYRLEQGNIVMLRWPALDQAERMRPIRYPLLEGVREFKWRYLDTSGYWLTQWPTADNTGGLPQAAEVSLTLINGDKFTRIFALQ